MDQASQSPSSTADTAKFPAAKDRNCPFCGQAFTSSSLGRHLDLYIKPKNPKYPDGIHNVDVIRQVRQHITRRQTRTFHHHNNNGTAGRDSSTPTTASKPASPMSSTHALLPVPRTLSLNGMPREGIGTRRNFANWQATGVINHLPPLPVSTAPTPELRRDMSRHQQVKIEHEQRQILVEERESSKAVEMALKEVLGAIKMAGTEGNTLFDFNPYALGFPGLCLRILPAPSTLFTTTPFQSNNSWTVGPPGRDQLNALHREIQAGVRAKREHQYQIHTNGSLDGSTLAPLLPVEQEMLKLLKHAQETYNHWMSLSEQQRQECWQLEILRAFAGERDACRDTQASLDEARLEIPRLRAQVSRLIQRHGSGEGYQPPPLSPLPTEVLEHMATSSTSGTWDYDSLVEKWRAWVRAGRTANGGMEHQRQTLSGIASSAYKNIQGLPGSPHENGYSTYMAPKTVKAEQTSGSPDARGVQDGLDTDTREHMGDWDDVDADGDADGSVDGEGEVDEHRRPPSRMPSDSYRHRPPAYPLGTPKPCWRPPVQQGIENGGRAADTGSHPQTLSKDVDHNGRGS